MTGYGLRDVLSRSFYSMKDTKTPMINGALAVLVNIILNLILVRYLELGGLALSTSIAAIFATFLLFNSLRKKIGSINGKQMFVSFLKAMVASLIMGITVYFVYNHLITKLPDKKIYEALTLFVTIVVGALVYVPIVLLSDKNAFNYFKKGVKFINAKFIRLWEG
jgi:putative peptidoglycan lipid II flippase